MCKYKSLHPNMYILFKNLVIIWWKVRGEMESKTLGRRCPSINGWRVRNVRGVLWWPLWLVRKLCVGTLLDSYDWNGQFSWSSGIIKWHIRNTLDRDACPINQKGTQFVYTISNYPGTFSEYMSKCHRTDFMMLFLHIDMEKIATILPQLSQVIIVLSLYMCIA